RAFPPAPPCAPTSAIPRPARPRALCLRDRGRSEGEPAGPAPQRLGWLPTGTSFVQAGLEALVDAAPRPPNWARSPSRFGDRPPGASRNRVLQDVRPLAPSQLSHA